MTSEKMINAECGEKYVNDMTFKEWDQMLRYHSTYQYDSGPYEEEDEDESSDKSLDELSDDEWDDEWDRNHRSCSCDDDFCLSRVSSTGQYSHLLKYDENHICWCKNLLL